MSETTAPRKPLTSTTWADFPNGLYPCRSVAGRSVPWDAQADLGYELADRTHFSVEQARWLVEYCASGLPVVLTWETRLGNRYEGWRVQRQTTTVIVESVTAPSATHPESYPGEARLRYCGFGHPVYLNDIVDIRGVDKTIEFVDICIECDRPEDKHAEGCVAAGGAPVYVEDGEQACAESGFCDKHAGECPDPVDLADEAAGNSTPGSEY